MFVAAVSVRTASVGLASFWIPARSGASGLKLMTQRMTIEGA